MIVLRLGGALRGREHRLADRAFTTIKGATRPANHLLGHAAQEAFQP